MITMDKSKKSGSQFSKVKAVQLFDALFIHARLGAVVALGCVLGNDLHFALSHPAFNRHPAHRILQRIAGGLISLVDYHCENHNENRAITLSFSTTQPCQT